MRGAGLREGQLLSPASSVGLAERALLAANCHLPHAAWLQDDLPEEPWSPAELPLLSWAQNDTLSSLDHMSLLICLSYFSNFFLLLSLTNSLQEHPSGQQHRIL